MNDQPVPGIYSLGQMKRECYDTPGAADRRVKRPVEADYHRLSTFGPDVLAKLNASPPASPPALQFTWEDVDLLQQTARAYDRTESLNSAVGSAWARDFAERLAAALPARS